MILILCGLIIYIINYIIGWLLHFRFFEMKKSTHQIFFAAIIINLVLIIIFVRMEILSVLIICLSLLTMLLLPLGIKGGVYHRVLSSLGLFLYVSMFILQFMK